MDLSKWNPFKFLRKKKEEKAKQEQLAKAQASTALAAPAAFDPQHFDRLIQQAWTNPFALLREPWPAFGGLSEGWFGDHSLASFSPRVDVVDEKDHLRVSAEIPGLGPEDVHLSVQEGLLTLKGEKRHEAESEEEGCFRTERSYGFFERRVPLPRDVDTEQAEATFEKGVLAIRFPKRGERSAAREIPIK
ncbi:MAG TPA: heat-shock protein Hsp20 [Planctomycetes bacterium]|nr:heat-shock protein Hsp20 [Planctomycetota bacterium]|tara:strand:- start:46 stop:615 length:570 start_codon:yes stop_codon:yes gene_type:complete